MLLREEGLLTTLNSKYKSRRNEDLLHMCQSKMFAWIILAIGQIGNQRDNAAKCLNVKA
jgi:hypothetical protein